MKENNKNKKKLRLPKRSLLTYILLVAIPVVLFFIIAIPVLYVNEYNAKKVTPFANDIKDLDASSIIYGDKNTIEDFNFVLYCTKYDDNSGAVTFRTFAYENENTRKVMNMSNQISVKLQMCSDWIKTEISSSARSRYVAPGPKTATGSSRYYAEYSISGVPNLPQKGNLLFVNIETIPVYAYVTYTTTINGTETKKRYILKYEYSDYVIGKVVIKDTRDVNARVYNDEVQWQFKNDTSWTSLQKTYTLDNTQVRVNDTMIQWKNSFTSDWVNLRDISSLAGAGEGKTPEVRVSGKDAQWKYPEDSSWRTLQSVISLDAETRVENGYVQWKRVTDQEWKNLKKVSELKGATDGATPEVRISNDKVQYRFSSGSYEDLATLAELKGAEVRIEGGYLQWKFIDKTEWINLKPTNELEEEKNQATYGPTVGGIEK